MPDKSLDLRVIFKMVDRFSSPLKQSMQNFKNWSKSVRQADSAARRFGQSTQKVGKSMRGIGMKMSIGMTLPLMLFGRQAIRTANEFEKSMNFVGAVTRTKIGGTVTPAFQALRKEAKRLGAITKFTASEVAEGMKVLGLKGIEVEDIFRVLPKVLELATAAQMDIATSAGIVVSIMNSQKLTTED